MSKFELRPMVEGERVGFIDEWGGSVGQDGLAEEVQCDGTVIEQVGRRVKLISDDGRDWNMDRVWVFPLNEKEPVTLDLQALVRAAEFMEAHSGPLDSYTSDEDEQFEENYHKHSATIQAFAERMPK